MSETLEENLHPIYAKCYPCDSCDRVFRREFKTNPPETICKRCSK